MRITNSIFYRWNSQRTMRIIRFITNLIGKNILNIENVSKNAFIN